MEPEKEHIRFYIFTRMKIGDDPMKIHGDLKAVFGDSCVSYRTVCRWVEQFRSGKTSFEDKDHSGHPTSVRDEHTLMFVKKMVEEDPHITTREINERTDIALGTVQRILRDDLDLRKASARWVPYLLTDAQKQQRVHCSKQLFQMFGPDGPKRLCDVVTGDETSVNFYGIPNKRSNQMWVGAGDKRPVVLHPGFQSRKRRFTIFFDSSGLLVVDILPENTTLNATYYVESCLH